jgi:hypothetical protein
MNWEAVGAIGETIGAIALFLVLFQVRHAKHEMRRSVRSERTDSLLCTNIAIPAASTCV